MITFLAVQLTNRLGIGTHPEYLLYPMETHYRTSRSLTRTIEPSQSASAATYQNHKPGEGTASGNGFFHSRI